MHRRFRDTLLGEWGRIVTSRPRTVLAISLLLAVVCILLTLTRLEFRGDRSDLIDPTLPWNQRYAAYREIFNRWDDLIICVDGDPDDERIDEFARELADHLRSFERVAAADAGFSTEEIGPRLYKAAPREIFDDALSELTTAQRVARSTNANTALAAVLIGAQDTLRDPDAMEYLTPLLEPFLMTLHGDEPSFASWTPADEWIPLRDTRRGGRLRTILVNVVKPESGIDVVSANLAWLRGEVSTTLAASDLTDLEWGVTGIPAIEADETRQSIADSAKASVLALVMVTIMMLIVFRGIVVPLLATSALLIGIAWSFGWVVLSVGHLQLLSVVFTLILLGLGIDFALHLVSRLELVRDEHASLGGAITRVFRGIGPGLVTGALTTAAAFGITAFTKFKGVAEMGIIAAGGILLCLIAVMSTFPAGLAVTRRWKWIIRSRHGGEEAAFGSSLLVRLETHPRTTLTLALVVAATLGAGVLRLRYDPNILNLQPPGIESVYWEQRIVEESGANVWSALVETNAVDGATLADDLRQLPEVAEVGGMGLLFPADRDERAELVATAAEAEPTATLAPGLMSLRRVLTQVSGAIRPTQPVLADEIDAALQAAASADPEQFADRGVRLEDAFETFRSTLAAYVAVALAPEPPDAWDLPPALDEQWTSGDTWLLRVVPAPDPQGRPILDPDLLGPFIAAVRTVAAQAHGPPVQIYESSELIKREYTKAACYAVIVIFIILLIDFLSLADALSALVPVCIGFLGCFGGMGWFNVPMNFANIIVLPLIFGIGVDAGVHVVHRWRAQPDGHPAGLSGGTGRGITLTMLTTIIGFGCMTIAQHRGIRSLGLVMVMGLAVTLFACYLVLPAILRLRTQRGAAVTTSAPAGSAPPDHPEGTARPAG